MTQIGRNNIIITKKQEGINRRKKSEKLWVYFFSTGFLSRYNNSQEFLDQYSIENWNKLSRLIKLNTERFHKGIISQRIKSMPYNTYIFQGNDINGEKLLNYIDQLKPINLILYNKEIEYKNVKCLYNYFKKLITNYNGTFKDFQIKYNAGYIFEDIFKDKYISKPGQHILLKI